MDILKRTAAFALTLIMLMTSVALSSNGQSVITLKDESCLRFSDDGEYVIGIDGVPDADDVLSQFSEDADLSIVTHSGEARTGKIASDDRVVLGDSSVKLLVYGDVDRSASLNTHDVIDIMKYFCGYDVDICVLAADVTADGKYNMRDVVLLMKYLVGADVILGDITYPAVEFEIDPTYRVVIGKNADETEEEAAYLLCTALDSLYGDGVGAKRIITDDRSADNEIIVGKTNRQLYAKDRAKLGGEGYFYDVVKPSRIVIGGSDGEATYEAVNQFLWDNYAYIDKFNTVDSAKIFDGTDYVDVKGSTKLFSANSRFRSYPENKPTVTLNGAPIEEYTVVPRNEDFAACADILIRDIRVLTGKTLACDADYAGDRAIYVGRIANGGNYSQMGLAYNIGAEGDSVYIDAYRLNVCRYAVRVFSSDYLLNDFTDRDIKVEGNTLDAYNSNRLRLTSTEESAVAEGVTYYHNVYTDPHRLNVETFAVVIKNGSGRFALGTPNGETAISGSLATTTSEMKTLMNAGENVICGINADFYDLGGNNRPKGLCVKDGTVMQQANGRPWFAVLADGSFKFGTGSESNGYIDSMVTAVGGSHLFLRNGLLSDLNQDSDFSGIRHPRTALGMTSDGDIVFLVVDGRMPAYSNGASITDLALLMLEYGVTDALNLDGGGSSTLAIVEGGSPIIKNTPCDVFERPIYDSLVFIAD